MGCSAAKNLTIEPLNGNKVTEISSENRDNIRKVSIPVSVSDVPPLEGEDPQTEMLEAATVNNMQKAANGMSFEIAFDEEGEGESIIKKHPPKRFQRLEEQQTSPTSTLVKLQEKLDEAEIRRQQILQQRVQSAKYRNNLKKQASASSITPDEDHLKIPPEVPPPLNSYDVSYL